MTTFVTGSASTFATVQAAIIAACVADGWTSPTSDIIAKGDCFIKMSNTATYLAAQAGLGQSGGVLSNPTPFSVYCMDPLSGGALTWPATYNVHVGNTGVVMVLNFSADHYIYLMFGQDPVAGLPGKGVWISASSGSSGTRNVFTWSGSGFNTNTDQNAIGTGPFMIESVYGLNTNSYVHHGLDGHEWTAPAVYNIGNEEPNLMAKATGGLCSLMTKYTSNAWNNEAVLAPMQPYIDRTSNKASFIADINIARYVRIGNYLPGAIITLGTDKWRLYPIYKKDATTKLSAGASVNAVHTGTLGMAVRYYGP